MLRSESARAHRSKEPSAERTRLRSRNARTEQQYDKTLAKNSQQLKRLTLKKMHCEVYGSTSDLYIANNILYTIYFIPYTIYYIIYILYTYSRSHALRYERKNTNPTLVRMELTTSALAGVQVTY